MHYEVVWVSLAELMGYSCGIHLTMITEEKPHNRACLHCYYADYHGQILGSKQCVPTHYPPNHISPASSARLYPYLAIFDMRSAALTGNVRRAHGDRDTCQWQQTVGLLVTHCWGPSLLDRGTTTHHVRCSQCWPSEGQIAPWRREL